MHSVPRSVLRSLIDNGIQSNYEMVDIDLEMLFVGSHRKYTTSRIGKSAIRRVMLLNRSDMEVLRSGIR